jgi:hypothetical protein
MGNSAPVPPGDGNAPEGDDLDEAEMTSIMDAEQRRELQRVTRAAKEPERETARPPPEAMLAVEAEVVIPKAAAVPAEALPGASEPEPESRPSASPSPSPSPAQLSSPAPSATWFVVAFVLLAAAIAFEMR